ncbi:MAG: anion permease [Methanomicrobiales archaeon]
MLFIAGITILIAFVFTFTNGFQDAASIAATFIASRSATPARGITLVAIMAGAGAVLGGSAVAFTLSGLLAIAPGETVILVLFAALLAAAAWNLLAWRLSLPSSSTHALIGGMVGAGMTFAGVESVYWGWSELMGPDHELTGLAKILLFLILSVIAGLAGGFVMRKTTALLLRNARRRINATIRRFNWMAAAGMAFYNGANDAQKQMGIIALVLLAAGETASLEVPLWARIGCALLLAAGTLGGGWRIMKTLGARIFTVTPIHSFDSQVASGATLAVSTLAGAPVSSTCIIAGSVLGVGAAENPRKVQWSVGRDIAVAMVLAIPGTMAIAGLISWGIRLAMGM